MESEFTAQWIVAGIFWCLSFYILSFNIIRQHTNQKRLNNGDTSQVSGISFLTTIFAMIGFSAAPFEFSYWFYLVIFLEIPAIINFIEEPATSDDESSTSDEEDDESPPSNNQ